MLKFAVSGKSRQTALFFLILIIKVSVTHRRCQILVSAFDFLCIFHPRLNLFNASFEGSESFSTRCQALHFVKLLCFSGLVREQCDNDNNNVRHLLYFCKLFFSVKQSLTISSL